MIPPKLVKASVDLGQQTDALTAALKAIDTRIHALNLGIEAWVPLPPVEGHGNLIPCVLGYVRLESGWGLALQEGDKFWAVAHAPRRLRVRVMDGLEALLGKLHDETLVLTQTMKDETLKAEAFMKAIQS